MEPTAAYISHKNLKHNIGLIRKAVGSRRIMAVVKANAYGHGDIEVARTAVESGCEMLGVALPAEGIRLRDHGIDVPVLVFGAQLPENFAAAAQAGLTMTVTSPEQAAWLENHPTPEPLKVHVKIDSGMNRVGFALDDCLSPIRRLEALDHIRIEGLYSHFATSDERDLTYARKQLARFADTAAEVQQQLGRKLVVHMANSGAIMQLPEAYFDMVRPGIMLYGYDPDPDHVIGWDLKPVMTLHSRLGLIKLVPANEPVSYGRRYYTREDTYIGIIPIGYADGFDRSNTNNARVLIGNRPYPLVGTVCMDMVMVDLGTELKCAAGDEVIVYGGDRDAPVNIRQIARRLGTIPYEITCRVSGRVPRIHLYD